MDVLDAIRSDRAVAVIRGVTVEDARAFLEAGAIAVYAGSSLAPPDLVATGDHEEIGRRAHAFVAALS